MTILRLFAAVFLSSALVSLPVLAESKPANNAPVTREQIPALVREALMNDPEMVKDAIEKLQIKQEEESKKQAKSNIVKNKADLFSSDSSPVVGDAKADVTIVEFFDYHCGYCKMFVPTIVELLEKDKKVRVVFKEFPILSEDSMLASRVALAVNRLDKSKYFDFHKAVFAMKGRFDEKNLFAEAKKLGLDEAKLKAELAKPEIDAELEKNRKLADALAIRGTPAVIVGDEVFPGKISYDELKKAVDAARASSPVKK